MKQTKIGLIPEDWEVVKLGDNGEFLKGNGITKDQLKTEGIPCILYGQLYTKYNFNITKFYYFIDKETSKTATLLKEGDILFAGSGETAEEIGKCAVLLSKETCYVGGDIIILRNHKQDNLFMGYLLNSPSIIKQKSKLGQGHSVVHIYSNKLAKIEIPLPPFPEQKKIAVILSTWDEAIEKLESLVALKEKRKKGLMQSLLTGKKRLKGFITKAFQKTKIGMIPDDWEVKKLGETITHRKGFAFKSEDYTDRGIRIIRISDTNETTITNNDPVYISETNIDNFQEYKLFENDLIVTTVGSRPPMWTSVVGKIISIPSHCNGTLLNQNMVKIIPNEKVIIFGFLRDLFRLNRYRTFLTSIVRGNANQGSIALEDLFGFLIPISSLAEQKRIAEVLSAADNEINLHKEEIEKIKLQKKGLMQKLLTGQVRVRVK